MEEKTRLTTAAGAPVVDNQNVQTAGRVARCCCRTWFLEKLAHFDREVIPERRMHAKGSAAYGTFTVTHDITPTPGEDLLPGRQEDRYVPALLHRRR